MTVARILWSIALCLFGGTAAFADVALKDALERAGENRTELEKALESAPAKQRPGVEFLIAHMPAPDLRTLSAEFILENVALAYDVMEKVPWGPDIPEEIFFNDVLPYANVNERRDRWRKDFVERFLPLVAECKTPSEAAQTLNAKIFGELGVRYSTKRKKPDQSPYESMEIGLASCTGLSIILSDACRAVGVPARLAGIPRWVNKSGNHTWVEVWDGDWHFTGAAEPDGRGLNHTWFQGDAALAKEDSVWNAIYAVSYRKTDKPFPLVWNLDVDWVPAVNVTRRYVPADAAGGEEDARLLVRVIDVGNGERLAAEVTVTDREDATRVFSGTSRDESHDLNDVLEFRVPKGRSYRVRAVLGGRRCEGFIEALEEDMNTLTLTLTTLTTAITGTTLVVTSIEKELRGYFAADPAQRASFEFDEASRDALMRDEREVRNFVWKAYRDGEHHESVKADFEANRVRYAEHESPYTVKEVGKRPAGGWPLFIAMHGGGGVPKHVNDSQWKVMQRYYRDQDSVEGYKYLALRAPNDTWNGFYDLYVYPLVTNLVKQFLLCGDVDPNRVFIMGYSHGGYGAFAIGPKIPERFAAVHSSAAAPTDGQSSAKNLRNTVFTYMIGENDNAYGRRTRCEAFDEKIRGLRGDRTDIYPVTMEFQEGFGHGGLPDRDKIADMYRAVRNPVPADLTWELTDSLLQDFYWVHVPEPRAGRLVETRCADNRIDVTTRGIARLTLRLDRRLVDFSRPVIVNLDGVESRHELEPSLRTLCETTLERGDVHLAATAELELKPLSKGLAHDTRDIEGWTVHVDTRLLAEKKELGALALKILGSRLHDVALVVPEDRLAKLKRVAFWLDLDRPGLKGMQYHPSRDWLVDHGHDPRLVKCVHIPGAPAFVDLARSNEQPWVVLHELAHAYHDQVLGFDEDRIRAAYDRAVASGSYEKVLHIRREETKHYALTNHKEYFAELTEAFFGTNDFFPFVRSELEQHDPDAAKLLRDIWGK